MNSRAKRKQAGEQLNEPSNTVKEYNFEATEKGIGQLRPKDRPIPIGEVEWVHGRAFRKKK